MDIPTIFITSLHTTKDMEIGFNAGADDYIRKPFHLSELKLRIDNIKRLRKIDSKEEQKLNDEISYDYELKTNHCFVHDDAGTKRRNSVWLCSKTVEVSKKEFEYRALLNAKEHDVIASERKYYDKFVASTYNEYLSAVENATTDMMWIVFDDVKVADHFKFDMYFPKMHKYDNEHDYNLGIAHAFVHDNGDEETFGGVWLCPRDRLVSKREFDYRSLINFKEHPIVASTK